MFIGSLIPKPSGRCNADVISVSKCFPPQLHHISKLWFNRSVTFVQTCCHWTTRESFKVAEDHIIFKVGIRFFLAPL